MDEVIAAALSDLSGSDKGNQGFHLQEQYARVCLENGTGLYSETPIKRLMNRLIRAVVDPTAASA